MTANACQKLPAAEAAGTESDQAPSGAATSPAGTAVTALTTDPDVHLDAARAATASLRPAERPRALLHLDALPLRPTGKPDRRAAAALAQRLAEEGRAETR